MLTSISATNPSSFRSQRLYFSRASEVQVFAVSSLSYSTISELTIPTVPSLYSQSSDSSLRPLPFRIPAACDSSTPNTPPLSTATISLPPPRSHFLSPLTSKDQSLQSILTLYNSPAAPPNSIPDTSVADLLTLLRLKISSLPLESASIAESFSSSLSTQPNNRFKHDCRNILTGYMGGLKQSETLLSKPVIIGEDLIRGEDNVEMGKTKEEATKTNRQRWWFVARTVLAQAGQKL